jgi:hypothetical protein
VLEGYASVRGGVVVVEAHYKGLMMRIFEDSRWEGFQLNDDERSVLHSEVFK